MVFIRLLQFSPVFISPVVHIDSRQCSSAPVGFGWGFTSTEHCSNTHFYLFLDCNQHWRDGVFVMLLTSFRMRRKIRKYFYKTAARNVSNIFTVAGGIVNLRKGCSKGNSAEMLVLFCVSQKQSDSGYVLKLPRVTVRYVHVGVRWLLKLRYTKSVPAAARLHVWLCSCVKDPKGFW